MEEAAGTALYKTKKKQAQSRLESSEQNLTRLEDIIAEVSRAKNSLRRQAGATIQYRKLREKIRQLTSLHYRKKIFQIERNLQEITLQHEKCLSLEKEVVSLLKEQEKSLSRIRKEVWDLEKTIKEDQKNLYALNSQLSQLETDKDKEAKRAEFIEEQKKRTSANLEEVKQEKQQIAKEAAQVKAIVDELKKALKKE